ncbi:DUF6173 family protein [Bacillus thuringiensis]|uniref:DUF6173 family protein n=1 Tax=Bacillus thuringiensis TaxID=1428 RepID=UPI001F0B526F|nr:DUF6173 family protein [Bacillus thuringiensis]
MDRMDGVFNSTAVPVPSMNFPQIKVATDPNLASEFYSRLVEMINDFDETLDLEHEVGMRLVSYGQTVQFHIEDLGYYNPSLIRFYGRMENGSRVELIQHVSQISFLLIAVKRLNPEEPKRSIGFSNSEEE